VKVAISPYPGEDLWTPLPGALGIDELLGWHVAKLGDRGAALEPIRQGVRHAFGDFRKDYHPESDPLEGV
jgi:hypothetical protein